MKKKWDTFVLCALTLATAALAAVLLWREQTTWLEAASFVTGAVCVWLTVKENVWNFPISLVNVVTFSVVFFGAHLYADASLQVIYFVLTLIGWYMWLYGGTKHTALHIVRTGTVEMAAVAVALAAMTVVYWQILRHIGGSATFWDSLTTAISLGAQWLLNRKRLENWVLWIAVDVLYVPLYLYKHLYLTAILYAVFLIMAIMGLREWYGRFRRQKEAAGRVVAEVAEETAA